MSSQTQRGCEGREGDEDDEAPAATKVEDEDGKEERRRGGIKKKSSSDYGGTVRPGIALCSDTFSKSRKRVKYGRGVCAVANCWMRVRNTESVSRIKPVQTSYSSGFYK